MCSFTSEPDAVLCSQVPGRLNAGRNISLARRRLFNDSRKERRRREERRRLTCKKTRRRWALKWAERRRRWSDGHSRFFFHPDWMILLPGAGGWCLFLVEQIVAQAFHTGYLALHRLSSSWWSNCSWWDHNYRQNDGPVLSFFSSVHSSLLLPLLPFSPAAMQFMSSDRSDDGRAMQ